jgi:predicted  nucleic acid-binding Zn-ribbon protein
MKFIPLLCLIPLLTLPLHAQDTAVKAREMTSNLEKIESLIDKTIKELREAVEQLTRISTESDKPRDAFEDFTDQLKDYKDVQSTLAERIDHFRSIADTRFADWEKDVAKMEGDLKAISQTRMNKGKKEYADIDKKVRTIGAKLTKAVDKLQEVQTYFTTELNSASIQAASKVTDAAKKSADDVMQTLEGMKADYRQLKADTSENSTKSKD